MVAGLADGAGAGYRAVETVVSGLQDGLRRQAARPAYGQGPGRPAVAPGPVARGTPALVPHLIKLICFGGQQAHTNFVIWNTGQAVLSNLVLCASTFTGPANQQPDPGIAVSFEPDVVPPIRPGGSVTILVTLTVPANVRLGLYRGLIHAHTGDARAVVELTVPFFVGP